MDFSDVLAGLNVSPGIAAIIGAGLLVAAVGFAAWLTETVASFFDSDDCDGEPEDYYCCAGCGWNEYDDGLYGTDGHVCPQCGGEVS